MSKFGDDVALAFKRCNELEVICERLQAERDALKAEVVKLEGELSNVHAFAFNLLPERTENDMKDTVDEQLGLLDRTITKMTQQLARYRAALAEELRFHRAGCDLTIEPDPPGCSCRLANRRRAAEGEGT